MCYVIQSTISYWLPLNFTVILLTIERHPIKQWHRADSLHHPGERSTPPYLELTAFQACLDDGKWMPGYHEQYPYQSLLPLENLKTVTQNKRGKKPLYHFLSGFLLSGEAAEKPQDTAPKHLKGKVVSFPKSIKRKRRWCGPASKEADWDDWKCTSGWGLPCAVARSSELCRLCTQSSSPRQRRRVWRQKPDRRLERLRWTCEFFYDLGCPTCSCEGKATASSHKGVKKVSALRCSYRCSLYVLLWFWVWLYCYPHSSPVFDQALVGTPVVCQPSSSLPADELTYYMRLPWQGDHLPVAIFKIKIRFLKTSSSCHSWKLRPTATMQIRTCPVPESCQQRARNKPHPPLSAGLSGRRREAWKRTFKTFPRAYIFWCHFLLLS